MSQHGGEPPNRHGGEPPNRHGGYPPNSPDPHGSQPLPRCVRHPDRPTGLTCVRCGRPACPECLREAAVGYQCVDCVQAGAATVRPARTVAGARMSTGFTPVVTYVLVAVNVLVYAITVLQSGSITNNERGSKLFSDWKLWPPAVADGQLFRLIGSGFLHYGALHLAVNMFALWIVGRDIEQVLGRSRYAAVYFVSLLGGSAAVMALDLNSATAGASGAIFGLFGALGVIVLRLRQNPGPIAAIIVINVVISVATPGISLAGHLGGLAAGTAAAVALLYVPGWLRPGGTPTAQRAIGWSALAAIGLIDVIVIAVRIAAIREQLGI